MEFQDAAESFLMHCCTFPHKRAASIGHSAGFRCLRLDDLASLALKRGGKWTGRFWIRTQRRQGATTQRTANGKGRNHERHEKKGFVSREGAKETERDSVSRSGFNGTAVPRICIKPDRLLPLWLLPMICYLARRRARTRLR